MANRLKLVLLLMAITLFSNSALAKERRLLVLGDSLSAAYNLKQEQGWVSLLQNAWTDKNITIINAAISGETSDGGLARLPRLLEQHLPTHLFLELGANDGLRGYPVKKMKQNLAKIIEIAQAESVKVIIQEMRIPTNFGPRYTRMFTQSYTQLGEQYNAPVVPFFLADVALKPELMQQDQLHPNADAQPILAEQMSTTLLPLL